ncbi:MAG: hypothetical protein LBQ66_11955 [Planctomycetaceae bacterium]|nr:hypothetical protein [Planctomycetaceae bacterium]
MCEFRRVLSNIVFDMDIWLRPYYQHNSYRHNRSMQLGLTTTGLAIRI